MNENINLIKILKNCPKGWEFYSSLLGEVEFEGICDDEKEAYPIRVKVGKLAYTTGFTKEGVQLKGKGECTLFPSKDHRDWSKFTAPWYKKERFDPKTLKPFDKIIFKGHGMWFCGLFSHIHNSYACIGETYHKCVIPYNDDTKHLVGTRDEAPEFYKYWED